MMNRKKIQITLEISGLLRQNYNFKVIHWTVFTANILQDAWSKSL